MILVDANLLIYAWNTGAPEHDTARAWLEARLNGVEGVGMPWVSLLAFVRIVTNARIFPTPATTKAAWAQVDEWIARDNVFVPEPTQRHGEILATLREKVDRPSLVPAAHLAALAIEYGLVLCSADRDFARFSELAWENPLDGDAAGPATTLEEWTAPEDDQAFRDL